MIRYASIRRGGSRRPKSADPLVPVAIRRGGLHPLEVIDAISVERPLCAERSDNAAGGDGDMRAIEAFLELLAEIAIEATAPRREVTLDAA